MDNQMMALNPVDFSTMAAASTAAKALSGASPALSGGTVSGHAIRRFIITTETAACRWRADGTDPTTTTGHLAASTDTLSFTGANYKSLASNLKFIAVVSTCNFSISWFD